MALGLAEITVQYKVTIHDLFATDILIQCFPKKYSMVILQWNKIYNFNIVYIVMKWSIDIVITEND